ncbi:P-loop containing nucleoside triphosphate hydrolase protein [Hortaea werneckii]|nr:P-loop containing nucleoside triphosphate hydrolase protein [Hortaea werneckii]
MGIPALLYTLQNSLQYIGISNLDAATFQVTYQLKILTTALFSVTLLGKSLSPRRWTSLVLLMVGVAIVQIPLGGSETPVLSIKDLKDGAAFHSPRSIWDLKALGNVAAGQLSKRSATYEGIGEDEAAAHPQLDASIGLIAVIIACGLSGMAGVYFEKVLKDPKGDAHRQSVWVRNVQLSFYSLWPALLIGVLFKDGEQIAKTGFFTGYNWVVWVAITLQAIGGVVVALAVNYADNIAKNFATSISILVSFLASVFFFNFHIKWLYLLGTATVVGATYLYNADPDHRGRPPPISVTSYNEKNNEPGYFDLESVPTPARTPIRGDGLSTSRPTTPGSRSRPRILKLTVSSLGAAKMRTVEVKSSKSQVRKARRASDRTSSFHLQPSSSSLTVYTSQSASRPSFAIGTWHRGIVVCRNQWRTCHGRNDQRIDHAHAPYPAHEVRSYLADDVHHDTAQEFADQPLTLDSFDEQLLRLPDPNSRYGPLKSTGKAEEASIYPVTPSTRLKLASRVHPPTIYHFHLARLSKLANGAQPCMATIYVSGILPAIYDRAAAAGSSDASVGRRCRSSLASIHTTTVEQFCERASNSSKRVSCPTVSAQSLTFHCSMRYNPNASLQYTKRMTISCSLRQRVVARRLRSVQSGSVIGNSTIIVTTPEKWDSMTRKWKDHQKLMQMVKLFLIDEVHMLKDDRGATLEAVVSRMKSVGSNVRFIALSATVPNSEDIAKWLGKDHVNTYLPAVRECFGEEFRPVRLQKHVLGSKILEVISKWSMRKPLMVFCFTRAACVETAKALATWWSSNGPKDRFWSAPRQKIIVGDKDLLGTISSGVAFHHAGLQMQDRTAVEKGYLEGHINVICCTSTLAVGVNLPCHMVIIKNTVTYQNAATGGCKEYSDLEIMQMLGRAGRPQFDDSAVAVIMTRSQRVQHYERMLTGQEILESCLHRNLIDHLNAEIGLGTVTSVCSAKKWLTGTFLYVRLTENPEHYKLDSDAPGRDLDERLENICRKAISQLEHHDLVRADEKLQCTEFGDAMARYYLQFDTMKAFLSLPPKAKISEILSMISQAAEFREVRFRAGEKSMYKDLNKNQSIKFPIAVNLDLPAHKVSLIIQSVLGAVDLPSEEGKHRMEYQTAKSTIFQHVHRLVRCIIDCQLHLNDAVTTRNALLLARSLAAQVWDDSPLHMKQLEGVGPVAVRKLAGAGIKSIGDIENSEAHRLEHILSRNPPYGAQLQERARDFPKLRVSPSNFNVGLFTFVCLLRRQMGANSFDGRNAGRSSVCNVRRGCRHCAICSSEVRTSRFSISSDHRRRANDRAAHDTEYKHDKTDEFDDAGIDDTDLVLAENDAFTSIDELDLTMPDTSKKAATSKKGPSCQVISTTKPRQLSNGRWACNHSCKDKVNCKHLCCKEGLEHPPHPPKSRQPKNKDTEASLDPKQKQLVINASKKTTLPSPLTSSTGKHNPSEETKEGRSLAKLHSSVKGRTPPVPLISRQSKPREKSTSYSPTLPGSSTYCKGTKDERESDYGNDAWDSNDLPDACVTDSKQSAYPVSLGIQNDDLDTQQDDLFDIAFSGALSPDKGQRAEEKDIHEDEVLSKSSEDFIKDSLSESLRGSTRDDAQMSGALADQEWSEGLFVSDNGQCAGDGLPGDLTVPKKRPAPSSDSKSDEFPTGTPTTTSKKQKLASPVSSVQQRNELDEIMQPAMQQTPAAVGDFEKQRPQSPGEMDHARAFFDEFLGNEHFNFIG